MELRLRPSRGACRAAGGIGAHSATRWAAWVFIAALLLYAAMPMLASAAAQWQQQPLFEVCTVYGVARVPAGDDAPGHAPAAGGAGAVHCVLAALGAWHAADAPVLQPARARRPLLTPRPHAAPPPGRDGVAGWIARLGHGPPAAA